MDKEGGWGGGNRATGLVVVLGLEVLLLFAFVVEVEEDEGGVVEVEVVESGEVM